MSGEVQFLDLAPVKIGKKIDWRWSPYKNRSWDMVFSSLRWVGRLVADYETSGEEKYLARATELIKSWVASNPRGSSRASRYAWDEHPIALRAPVLVCLSKHVKASWLTGSLVDHGKVLADPRLYQKGHNHGLDQDIALLRIGCRTARKEWASLAVRRMTGTVKLGVDSQGALLEQAPRYGVYVRERLKVAMESIEDCGRKVPSEITKRWESLAGYITHATKPDGFMVPIGDGAADVRPSGYEHPAKKVQIFKAGYVFGRTEWDEPESAYYSIRFGPGLKYHGHEDHLGVTYAAQGRDVLVEAGFHSYENTAYRYWTMSPEAHNVPVVVGKPFRARTATALTHSSVKSDRQAYKFTDKAYGVSRTRSVLVSHGDDLMAVLDTVPSGNRARSYWHLDPDLSPTSTSGGRIVVKDRDGWKATVVQLAMPSCKPVGGQAVVRGKTNPYQGWISPSYMRKVPASVVVSPAAKSLLTIVVPGTGDPDVTCSGTRVTAKTADGSVSFRASASGTLS
ncbi:heparinase II/III family protein [Sphaerisporangium sp. TRM90804]|uniref:heparinase II/III domain-containing protein n=1 Tax=Sphaerisporangium sp. TRM90804 TaxID=3031113 RepID=UPI0024491CFC|nr:heparinase II/III family protein [Sphaerisporangium sp. TRM90804]MDH2427622.1 heparinase II/III family protein [Sphaerisporangium sp. TRM90804]